MSIYIDVTNLMEVEYITGIQRVVREVIIRLIKRNQLKVILLKSITKTESFVILDNNKFNDYFMNHIGRREDVLTNETCDIMNLSSKDIFFDIDSVWNSRYRRSLLLKRLKENGVKLAVYIYDIIPITHPQYCHENTVFNFLDYIGAYLQYADILIASAQSTLDEINALLFKLGLDSIPGYVSWLGADFSESANTKGDINEEVIRAVSNGKYVLAVGTIEPRKNHKLLMDAFDLGLFEDGINLIFAGRVGWNVEALEKRINNHKEIGKRFFHFKGLNDATIDYLYKNAFFVGFPTYNEGFGLPMIEAFQRNTPVIASNCKVLREVGEDYAIYFSQDDPADFQSKVKKYINNEKLYNELKEKIKTYIPFTWEQTTKKIENALSTLEAVNRLQIKSDHVEQLVVLTARCDDIISTLPYIESMMTFIKKLLICCPDNMVSEFKEKYKGNLNVDFLTDNEALNGSKLPEDHTTRNFFLRCMIMKSDKLDDIFIMSDDDYRPLENITIDTFIDNGKYVGYYFYYLDKWKGTVGNMTSFDKSMFRTEKFLKEKRMPIRQYSSHMPQIIDKSIYNELINKYPNVLHLGLDEWSTYFNYLDMNYTSSFVSKPYICLGWPGNPTDWDQVVRPPEYLFENYYKGAYEKGGIFESIPDVFNEHTILNSEKKKRLFEIRQEKHLSYKKNYDTYSILYSLLYREYPSFSVSIDNDIIVNTPQYLAITCKGFNWIPMDVMISDEMYDETSKLEIIAYYEDSAGRRYSSGDKLCSNIKQGSLNMPIWGPLDNSQYNIIIQVNYKECTCDKSSIVILV